jgi:hypothetical protein
MTDGKKEKDIPFDFAPGFDNQIAHAAASWAQIEYYINSSIWALADVAPGLGACMTSQIGSLHGRLNALLALMKLRQVNQKLIDRVNKFSEDSREPQDLRNRICHDLWLRDEGRPNDRMARLEIVANRKLSFEIVRIELDGLKDDLAKIAKVRETMHYIREAIFAAIPTLPEIPPSKLRPIKENL